VSGGGRRREGEKEERKGEKVDREGLGVFCLGGGEKWLLKEVYLRRARKKEKKRGGVEESEGGLV
jgi:hypothetical protein